MSSPSLDRRALRDVVVLQMARLGDFLQTTPLLASLACADPQVRVSVVVTPAQAPLARGTLFAHRVAVLDPDSLWDLAAPDQPGHLSLARARGLLEPVWSLPAEDVINLNLALPAATVAAGWDQARQHGWRLVEGGRAWQGAPWTRFVMDLVRDRRLTRLHLCDLLASYADPEGPPLPGLDYQVPLDSRDWAARTLPLARPQVVLQLGANNDLRRWPVDSYVRLARGLLDQGAVLALVGSTREKVLARRLLRGLNGAAANVRDLTGRTDLPDLAAVLEASDLVVSGDTGTLHLATAVGAKVLALYMGPAQVHETGPYGEGHLVLQARDACGPCQEQSPVCRGKAPCRALLTPELVLAAAVGLLEGRSPERAAGGLDWPKGVEALVGLHDAYGQRYRPLSRTGLEPLHLVALGLREAGRVLTRTAYVPDPDGLAAELTGEWTGSIDPAAPRRLVEESERLILAAESCDAQGARRLAKIMTGLGPLAGLVGPDAPPRLVEACRAADLVWSLAAAWPGSQPV